MENCLKEEEILTFDYFTSTDAFNLGNSITKKAMSNNLPIVIDIFAYGKQLFHFSTDATSQDNDRWVIRKRNTVLHFHHSSKYVNLKVKNDQSLLQSKYSLNRDDFVAIAGGFPIRIKNAGVVGAISVSGLKPDEDHQLVLDTLEEYLHANMN